MMTVPQVEPLARYADLKPGVRIRRRRTLRTWGDTRAPGHADQIWLVMAIPAVESNMIAVRRWVRNRTFGRVEFVPVAWLIQNKQAVRSTIVCHSDPTPHDRHAPKEDTQ